MKPENIAVVVKQEFDNPEENIEDKAEEMESLLEFCRKVGREIPSYHSDEGIDMD